MDTGHHTAFDLPDPASRYALVSVVVGSLIHTLHLPELLHWVLTLAGSIASALITRKVLAWFDKRGKRTSVRPPPPTPTNPSSR